MIKKTKTAKKTVAKKTAKKPVKKTPQKKAQKKAQNKTHKKSKKAGKKTASTLRLSTEKLSKKNSSNKKLGQMKTRARVIKKDNAKSAPKKVKSQETAKASSTMKYKINDLDRVPSFEIESTSGNKFHLNDYQNKTFVLYFYPKDSTPGCTIEGNDFTKLHPQFAELGVDVFGISRDSLKSHQNFIQKQSYCFDLLSDTDETVCKIFDVIQQKNMYGKMVTGIERSTFVIGQGKILKSWRKVKVEGHAQAVLDFVKALS